MSLLTLSLIAGFGSASYCVGLTQILRGNYRPNTFSRGIWLLLAINSMAGVGFSHGSRASLVLAVIFLIGNTVMCLGSLWKGSGSFGKLEQLCFGLIALSGIIWVLYPLPLINLSIGLFAHFIGGIPTFKNAYRNNESESTAFWSLFFIASLISLIASIGSPLRTMIFPLYFVGFDGLMILLSVSTRQSPLTSPPERSQL